MNLCYLQFLSGGTSDGYACKSLSSAKEDFGIVAAGLARYGQSIGAFVYMHSDTPGAYPDYLLSYEHGNVKVERA